jgi:hypothetical protein
LAEDEVLPAIDPWVAPDFAEVLPPPPEPDDPPVLLDIEPCVAPDLAPLEVLPPEPEEPPDVFPAMEP